MNIGLNLGMGNMGGGGAGIFRILFWIQNVLSLVATVGINSTFSRGGSSVTVPAWDATIGSILITTAADAIASPYMRFDAGSWFNDDGGGNSLHPTNSDGVFIVYQTWLDATLYATNSFVVDFVGVQAKYYKTTAGGTSSGTGVADDTGVVWVLQGNYSNGGGGTLPGLLGEPVAIERVWPSNDFTHVNYNKAQVTIAPNVITGPDGIAGSASQIFETIVNGTHTLRYPTSVAAASATLAPVVKADGRQWAGLQIISTTGGLAYVFFDLVNRVFGASVVPAGGTFGYIDHGGGWLQPWFKLPGVGTLTEGRMYLGITDSPAAYPGDITKGIFIFHQSLQLDVDVSSLIYTTTGAVQRNASTETNPRVMTAQYIRYRVTGTNTETHLADATNSFDYDKATTTLTFTDGTTTLTTVTALAIGDTIVLDQLNGTLYVNGILKDTDGALAPSWAAITRIGNITDLQESTAIDPTDVVWDK